MWSFDWLTPSGWKQCRVQTVALGFTLSVKAALKMCLLNLEPLIIIVNYYYYLLFLNACRIFSILASASFVSDCFILSLSSKQFFSVQRNQLMLRPHSYDEKGNHAVRVCS